jgi:Protein of unknown function (DUF1360)
MDTTRAPWGRVRAWAREQAKTYADGNDRPLGGYLKLISIYTTGTVTAGALARGLGHRAPDRVSPWDVALLSVASQRISRTIAKDPVTSPFRAPFTTYSGLSAPSELHEEVRGDGLKHAAGELLTCPMCLAQWVATALCFGLVVSPSTTRLVMSAFTAVSGADVLQHLYVKLQQATD